jgi:hypothetical protein
MGSPGRRGQWRSSPLRQEAMVGASPQPFLSHVRWCERGAPAVYPPTSLIGKAVEIKFAAPPTVVRLAQRGLNLVEPVGRLEDLARFRPVGRADNSVALHHVDQVGGAAIAYPQTAAAAGKWRPCRTPAPTAPHPQIARRCRRSSSGSISRSRPFSSRGDSRKPGTYSAWP